MNSASYSGHTTHSYRIQSYSSRRYWLANSRTSIRSEVLLNISTNAFIFVRECQLCNRSCYYSHAEDLPISLYSPVVDYERVANLKMIRKDLADIASRNYDETKRQNALKRCWQRDR